MLFSDFKKKNKTVKVLKQYNNVLKWGKKTTNLEFCFQETLTFKKGQNKVISDNENLNQIMNRLKEVLYAITEMQEVMKYIYDCIKT